MLRINDFPAALFVAKEKIYYHCQLSLIWSDLQGQSILQPKIAQLLIHWVTVYAFIARVCISFLPLWPILMKQDNHLVIFCKSSLTQNYNLEIYNIL